MPFNIDKLFTFCISEIRDFAGLHPCEIFYAFAVDASLLCLNSEQEFSKTLKEYQEDWDRKNRRIQTWEDLTEDDLDDSDFLLGLHESHSGLDRSDRDACLVVINESRKRRRDEGNPYLDPVEIQSLRDNTGDWEYQGFADMRQSMGFDESAYNDHYNMSEDEQATSEYGVAMDALIDRLQASGVFAALKTTPSFYASRVEHDY